VEMRLNQISTSFTNGEAETLNNEEKSGVNKSGFSYMHIRRDWKKLFKVEEHTFQR